MSRRNLIIVVVVLLVLVFAVWFGVHMMANGAPVPAGASDYAAVYLTNGAVYFGKLDWSGPRPNLTDAWVLEQSSNVQGQPQFNIAPFKNAFWTPIDSIYLNPQSVLFWTYIQSGSQLAKTLEASSS